MEFVGRIGEEVRQTQGGVLMPIIEIIESKERHEHDFKVGVRARLVQVAFTNEIE